VDRGIDPRGYDPAEEERKRVAAEQARREREEAERRASEERERMAREREERARRAAQENHPAGGAAGVVPGLERRDSVAVGVGRGDTQPKQFTFLGADDDDDEEEEE
jgi:hypothetical protein